MSMQTPSPLSRRTFLYLSGAAISSVALLAACGGTQSNDAQGKIVFWNSTYQTSDDNDKAKRKEDFYISKAIKRFEEANPGLTVDMQIVPGTPDMFTKYRVASTAKNGPDVMTLWSGNYMLQFKKYLEPLDSYFSEQERARLRGWSAVTDGFKEGQGKIYGVPNSSDGISSLVYNKQLLNKAGVDLESNPPKNFDEFLTMLGQIKASGTMPLAMYDNGYTFFSFDYWLAQVVGSSPGIDDLVSGKQNFSDPAVVEMVTKWAKLAQYSIPGAPTMDGGQASQYLIQKKAAMMVNIGGDVTDLRKTLGDNLGMIKLPDYSESVSVRDTGVGGAGTALIVSNYAKNKANAVKFIKFLVSKEEQTIQAEEESKLTNATDVDATKLYKEPFRIQQQEWALEPQTIFWPDNVFPAELTAELGAQAQLAWTGKITPAQFMSRLDAKRDALLKSSQ